MASGERRHHLATPAVDQIRFRSLSEVPGDDLVLEVEEPRNTRNTLIWRWISFSRVSRISRLKIVRHAALTTGIDQDPDSHPAVRRTDQEFARCLAAAPDR